MPKHEDHFEQFAPHTLLKHAVLKTYLNAWARKLLLRPRSERRVWYVDGFAGAGRDESGNDGSPVLAAQIAVETERQLETMGRGPVEVRTVFFEADKRRSDHLRLNLEQHAARSRIICGDLADHSGALLEEIKDEPALFFLDPFGLGLKANVVREALTGPRNEVLVLFADQAALRHLGAIVAEDSNLESELRDLTPSLFDDINVAQEQIVRERVEKRTKGLKATQTASARILDAAFNGPTWREVENEVSAADRRAKFCDLYASMLKSFGAAHVLVLPVRDETDHHVYHLIHATKSSRGYRTMKEAIDTVLKRPPIGEDAAGTMRFLIRSDLDKVVRTIRAHFAGQTVRWAGGDRHEPSVRRFALENTPAFPSELRKVQMGLRDARLPGKTIRYRFASA